MKLISQNNIPDLRVIHQKKPASTDLEAIENELCNTLLNSEGTIKDMCIHMASAGGKRVRPLLVLNCGLIFSGSHELLNQAALAAELIHMATLAHDDIIDGSQLRRGKFTLNKIWGNHSSVLCGDFLFARAFGILSGHRLYNSLAYMIEAIDNMCNGEIKQAENKFNIYMNREKYYEQITMKTARFLECCCKSGASIGDADEKQLDAAGKYGLNIGLAFQIIDDILDFQGNEAIMGKQKGEDLREGIITLPLILLMKKEKFKPLVQSIIGKNSITENDFELLLEMLISEGTIELSRKIALSHIDQALLFLQFLPHSPYKKVLEDMAEALFYRQS